MCGRYALYGPASRLTERFGVDFSSLGFTPRYNLAPLQFAPVLRGEGAGRSVAMLRWGLLPGWAKDPAMAARMINARCESAADKPAFRAAFRGRRCLVPVDGYYEWANTAGGKQPYLFRLRDGLPMALAGLWERREEPAGETLETFTILTTAANERLAWVHERMPVILPPEAWSLWLRPARTPAQLQPLLRPLPADELEVLPVDRRVGNIRNDDPALIEARSPV